MGPLDIREVQLGAISSQFELMTGQDVDQPWAVICALAGDEVGLEQNIGTPDPAAQMVGVEVRHGLLPLARKLPCTE